MQFYDVTNLENKFNGFLSLIDQSQPIETLQTKINPVNNGLKTFIVLKTLSIPVPF